MKKFKLIGLTLALIFFAFFGNAQTDELRNNLNTIFQNIDKSQVPTGFLEEYGAGLVPLDVFKITRFQFYNKRYYLRDIISSST